MLWIDQSFTACVVVSSGNFRVSGRTRMLFGLNQRFLFFSNKNCVFSILFFLFWGQLLGFSSQLPNPTIFGEISLWIMTEIWLLLVPLRAAFLTEMSAKWFSLASRESSLECPGILIIKVAGESIAFNNFQAQGPFLIVFPVEVRKPHYFHNISKSWAIQKHIYYQY